MVSFKRITASSSHPQMNDKIEKFHRTLKGEINRLPYEMPAELEETIIAFINYYIYQRYHEGLGNVTPYGVYTVRYWVIIQKSKDEKSRTLVERRSYNRKARRKSNDL